MPDSTGQAGAREIAEQIASAVQRQEGDFVRSTDLSNDLTAFMMFESVNLVQVAEELLTSFDICRAPSECRRSPE